MAIKDLQIVGQLSVINDCLDLISKFENKMLVLVSERHVLKNGNFLFKIRGDEEFKIQFEFIKKISLLYPELLFIADKIKMVEGMPV